MNDYFWRFRLGLSYEIVFKLSIVLLYAANQAINWEQYGAYHTAGK